MKKKKNDTLFNMDRDFESEVPVNFGRLLEDNLKKWQGGSQHIRGIGEYITNSDDSYRRLKKFSDQEIFVEIYSNRKNGKKIDKLIIRDSAEGMSRSGLESRFFQYFESHSGRTKGQSVTGQFGTGGKAYAIMNFKECYITSVKNGRENKAWFRWDGKQKIIVKGYNKDGYIDQSVEKQNGTTIELSNAKNKINLVDFVFQLNQLARIRHVIKSQKVEVTLYQGNLGPQPLLLEYDIPSNYSQEWIFVLPDKLKNKNDKENNFVLRYFEKPLGKDCIIDLSDGISTVADLEISKYDDRPFSKYLYGEMIVHKLQHSAAVRENRKGLEEGNDLTIEIEEFIEEKVKLVINEVQIKQRQKERERNIQTTNEKIKTLNKFLKKCELNFNIEVSKKLKKAKESDIYAGDDSGEDTGKGFVTPDNSDDELVNGSYSVPDGEDENSGKNKVNLNPDDEGKDKAVKKDDIPQSPHKHIKSKKGLVVLMTDDPQSPINSEEYGENEYPVIDRFLMSDGIILINANNPIIAKSRIHKQFQHIFNERVANYVLLIVAQYMTQKEIEMIPEVDRPDTMTLFKQKYFKLQQDLRSDKEIEYFDDNLE
ncbi:MAG: hypothetical protein GQ534_09385 [Candidatus Delongbacteria bacterium]|nr:hypothetical protein [Candidatus Delongbacteria bacterium]